MIKEQEPSYAFKKDWFTFVFQIPNYKTLVENSLAGQNADNIDLMVNYCLEKLQLDDATWLTGNHGIYKYSNSLVIAGENSIIVGYNDKIYPDDDHEKNTIMVQMSGAGYDYWLTYLDDKGYSLTKVERSIYNDDVVVMTPTRIDATLDLFNFSKEFSPYYVNEVSARGDYIGRSNPTWMWSYSHNGAITDDSKYSTAKEGHTMYFGRGGLKQLRIYNKLHERLEKTNQLYSYNSWYRWELELHGQAAVDWWNYYMSHGQSVENAWRFWLATNYRWVLRQGQKHQAKKSRYPDTWWYKELIGDFKNAKPIKHKRRIANYEKSYRYVNDQVFNVMYKMFSYKVQKYMLNGVNCDDAVQYAWNNVYLKFKARLNEQGLDYQAIANYFVGAGEDKIAEQMQERANEQKEHHDGV